VFKGWTFVCGLALAASAFANPAEAKYKVIYNFCSQANCTDGRGPNFGLIVDQAGNFYGTTGAGGAAGGGVVFELVKKKHGWGEKVLYSFCSQANCGDGQSPSGPLVMDVSGNLYGTTISRGAHGSGNVFELKKGKGGSWSLNILHSFCSENDCADGEGYSSGLSYFGQQSGALYDGTSPLYGTIQAFSASQQGLVYQLVRQGRKGWVENVVYNFCPGGGTCPDGANPLSAVLVDASSNIYGTTGGGGSAQAGTIFKLSPDGGTWTETVLYSFCSQADCADGSSPEGPLTVDGNGNFFGMTSYGGSTISRCLDNYDCGVIYELAAGGSESTLYRFCAESDCADGAGPQGGITIDETGKLYGVTLGDDSPSTLFSFDGSLKVLHSFCSKDQCTDGYLPYDVTLIRDAAGDLFGTTAAGGTGNLYGGVVFEWIP